jgi:hypothetical protein
MKKTLGQQEAQLLAYLQLRKLRTVRTGDLTGPLQITREQERELFRRMSRGGLIARVRPAYLSEATGDELFFKGGGSVRTAARRCY